MTGAAPVIADVNMDDYNINTESIKKNITKKTRAIIPVHFAGNPCNMTKIMKIAKNSNLHVVEDCAHALGSFYKNKHVGTIGDLGCFSFHETKNFSAGEGGALVVNKKEWIQRAHFTQEKGTDRSLVLKGVKSKYSWVDKGSSYLLSDILAAMLYAQLIEEDKMKALRSNITKAYFDLTDFHSDWFRISITDAAGKTAWSNPYWKGKHY